MIRKIFSIALIAVTTAAAALAATMWVGSYALEYEVPSCVGGIFGLPGWGLRHSFDDTREVEVTGHQGCFRVFYEWRCDAGDMAVPSPTFTKWSRSLAGFALGNFGVDTIGFGYAEVPFWFLVLALGSCPTLAFIRGPLRRWRRLRNGWCLHCGYALQGNVSGVCPECGTPR